MQLLFEAGVNQLLVRISHNVSIFPIELVDLVEFVFPLQSLLAHMVVCNIQA